MGEGAGRNQVDPCCGHGPDVFFADPAGGLHQGAPVNQGHGLLHGRRVHVVQHDDVGPGLQGLFYPSQVLHFNLNPGRVGSAPPRRLHRRPDPAGRFDVVVLDQHGIVKAEAVIVPAAHPDRVFFKHPEARRGFSGIHQAGLFPGNQFNQPRRPGGNAGQALQEIQGQALAGQDRPRPAGQFGQHLAALYPLAVAHQGPELNERVQAQKNPLRHRQPCHHSVLLGQYVTAGNGVRRHNAVGGKIAGAYILSQAALDQPVQLNLVQLHVAIPLLYVVFLF
ncbi:hypothetical protein PTH_0227 [Pelotomaculum thermopropionicum SI]|uniref:Uncharacterized protein n=1 Tax=Pelotomaculum thermopropionicum (strain DSM 13744 / JCM 10971 / SI) TaxID=370438 RepID=A5D5U0_PELTS|nr:hypothetical protein PTH_0227 [Pelotomaculum thermopropionicum SI]